MFVVPGRAVSTNAPLPLSRVRSSSTWRRGRAHFEREGEVAFRIGVVFRERRKRLRKRNMRSNLPYESGFKGEAPGIPARGARGQRATGWGGHALRGVASPVARETDNR